MLVQRISSSLPPSQLLVLDALVIEQRCENLYWKQGLPYIGPRMCLLVMFWEDMFVLRKEGRKRR